MAFSIRFSEEKNQILMATRGVNFETAILHVRNGNVLDEKHHHSKHRPNQRLYIIRIEKYVYVVPYVINPKKNEIFLKTMYPSRELTKQYSKKGE